MKISFAHNNINVKNLESSVDFYKKALHLEEVRRLEAEDGSFILVYLKSPYTAHELELTWLRDRTTPYNLGDNEFHLAFTVDDFDELHALHETMGIIVYENKEMGIYFIADPDGYWTEILPGDRY